MALSAASLLTCLVLHEAPAGPAESWVIPSGDPLGPCVLWGPCRQPISPLECGSLVLQAGERTDRAWTDFITEAVREIKKLGGGALGVTLSLGEQTEEVYRRWFEAGAHRYLLRIESSTPDLYARIHPDDGMHGFAPRLEALRALRRAGYQVGTGVMSGLPGQSEEDLARDLMFFRARRERGQTQCG